VVVAGAVVAAVAAKAPAVAGATATTKHVH
jgi:hypothetical protein